MERVFQSVSDHVVLFPYAWKKRKYLAIADYSLRHVIAYFAFILLFVSCLEFFVQPSKASPSQSQIQISDLIHFGAIFGLVFSYLLDLLYFGTRNLLFLSCSAFVFLFHLDSFCNAKCQVEQQSLNLTFLPLFQLNQGTSFLVLLLVWYQRLFCFWFCGVLVTGTTFLHRQQTWELCKESWEKIKWICDEMKMWNVQTRRRLCLAHAKNFLEWLEVKIEKLFLKKIPVFRFFVRFIICFLKQAAPTDHSPTYWNLEELRKEFKENAAAAAAAVAAAAAADTHGKLRKRYKDKFQQKTQEEKETEKYNKIKQSCIVLVTLVILIVFPCFVFWCYYSSKIMSSATGGGA